MSQDLARLVRIYFIALDGYADCDVSAEELRRAEDSLRNAVFTPEARIEDELRQLGIEHSPNPEWKSQVWSELAKQTARPPSRLRRAWQWLWNGWG